MLLRRGLRYEAGSTWTDRHIDWIVRLKFDDLASRMVVGEYVNAVQQLHRRRKDLEATIEDLLPSAPFASTAYRLRCFRGLATLSAVGLCCEVGDFHRFAKPSQLSAFLGIVPAEYTTDSKRRLGAITKAGSSHARRLLVEAAWHYRRLPATGITLARPPPPPPKTPNYTHTPTRSPPSTSPTSSRPSSSLLTITSPTPPPTPPTPITVAVRPSVPPLTRRDLDLRALPDPTPYPSSRAPASPTPFAARGRSRRVSPRRSTSVRVSRGSWPPAALPPGRPLATPAGGVARGRLGRCASSASRGPGRSARAVAARRRRHRTCSRLVAAPGRRRRARRPRRSRRARRRREVFGPGLSNGVSVTRNEGCSITCPNATRARSRCACARRGHRRTTSSRSTAAAARRRARPPRAAASLRGLGDAHAHPPRRPRTSRRCVHPVRASVVRRTSRT